MNKIWKDYYSVKKPVCPNCIKIGITEEEYNFCSTEKEPVKIYETDFWGREIKNKVKCVFNENYKCLVYHWTIYQGQGKLPILKSKI
ncbi:MAG: hypothetical protein I3273_05010 [Candidatus Moeniiplasma glomeromycotorum]|nr:hypothetical protein [Candidatus Moeniiplasma glomeromycotorum]MCE8167902.1 hypothetical protein [Candidatus Moeniiplasma glomeromycotorum]MCE8169452.1 hypothetical protein [Candidatus Moeniiplasma glomeromycotorum]